MAWICECGRRNEIGGIACFTCGRPDPNSPDPVAGAQPQVPAPIPGQAQAGLGTTASASISPTAFAVIAALMVMLAVGAIGYIYNVSASGGKSNSTAADDDSASASDTDTAAGIPPLPITTTTLKSHPKCLGDADSAGISSLEAVMPGQPGGMAPISGVDGSPAVAGALTQSSIFRDYGGKKGAVRAWMDQAAGRVVMLVALEYDNDECARATFDNVDTGTDTLTRAMGTVVTLPDGTFGEGTKAMKITRSQDGLVLYAAVFRSGPLVCMYMSSEQGGSNGVRNLVALQRAKTG